MDYLNDILTPDQIDTIMTAYGSISAWVSAVANGISDYLNNVVIEDIYF